MIYIIKKKLKIIFSLIGIFPLLIIPVNSEEFNQNSNLTIEYLNPIENICLIESQLETRNVDFQFGKEKTASQTTLSKSSSV